MKIHNVRLGFAMNSSSTHSLLFVRGPVPTDAGVSFGEFGWDHFTAASLRAKSDYVAMTLHAALSAVTHDDIAAAVVERWLDDGTPWSDRAAGYIDHQSMMALPRTFDGRGVHKEFFKEFRSFMLRDSLVILGGNDNDPEKHPLIEGSFELPLPRDTRTVDIAARKDPLGHWTLFQRDNGTKVRFTWDDLGADVVKSSLPELVDIKITDYCDAGCPYCYMGSTTKGAHAKEQTVRGLIYALKKMEVFEVALGGGEPTTHPKFADFVRLFRAGGVVPNFTTKSLAWLDKREIVDVLPLVGGFAFSTTTAADVHKLVVALDAAGVSRRTKWSSGGTQVNIQYVMGSTPLPFLAEVIKACADHELTLVLLGYKTTGRGSKFEPHDYKGWHDVVVAAVADRYMQIGIDTALAVELEADPVLRARVLGDHMKPGHSNIFYTTEEGKFSMYIDAVACRMGPSSYCESLRMRPLPIKESWASDDDIAAIAKAYAAW